jgi:hypothetical protein
MLEEDSSGREDQALVLQIVECLKLFVEARFLNDPSEPVGEKSAFMVESTILRLVRTFLLGKQLVEVQEGALQYDRVKYKLTDVRISRFDLSRCVCHLKRGRAAGELLVRITNLSCTVALNFHAEAFVSAEAVSEVVIRDTAIDIFLSLKPDDEHTLELVDVDVALGPPELSFSEANFTASMIAAVKGLLQSTLHSTLAWALKRAVHSSAASLIEDADTAWPIFNNFRFYVGPRERADLINFFVKNIPSYGIPL